jgi:ABC-type transport system involved in multi-copper enzyme maturation permease subunit
MSTATTTYAPPLVGAKEPTRPGFVTLTLVEMRKMIDTRSGKWLLGIIVFLSLAVAVIGVIVGHRTDRTFENFFSFTLLPAGVILPVLGILLVTSEWSQRTALTTFTLVPQRERIAVAKFLAGIAYSLVSLASCLLLAAIGNVYCMALDRGTGGWHLAPSAFFQALLLLVLSVTMGVAFGMAFLNSPLAIVLYFVLPIAFSIISSLITAISDTIAWLDFNAATSPLIGETLTNEQWGQLATPSALWIALPLVVGYVRLVRSELK